MNHSHLNLWALSFSENEDSTNSVRPIKHEQAEEVCLMVMAFLGVLKLKLGFWRGMRVMDSAGCFSGY